MQNSKDNPQDENGCTPSTGSGAGDQALKGRVQMADLARLAGVSTATVSRALAGSTLVNKQTRERIVQLANDHHYSINVGAQNLRRGENKTVAVVLPYDPQARQTVFDPFFLSMIGSLANALTDRGYEMLLVRLDQNQLDRAGHYFYSGRAMGLIIIGQWQQHADLNALAANRVPLVVWGAAMPGQQYVSVGSDNVGGGRGVTAHLLAQGCRRVAFLGNAKLPEVAQRYSGYLEAHRAERIAANPKLYVVSSFLPEQARVAMRELMLSGAEFDGIFAASDLLAMTAVSVLSEFGRRVPQDVLVAGYDDIEIAQHFTPSITTVRQPVVEAGHRMLDELVGLATAEQDKKRAPVLLTTALIVRSSSRPA